MATIYHISCPECGNKFEIMKGVTMFDSHHRNIPKDRRPETPFKCPRCKLKMSIKDPDFYDDVESVLFVD